MSFNPDDRLTPNSMKQRCPHCGELTTRRWKFAAYVSKKHRVHNFECVLCGKKSYSPPERITFVTIVEYTIAIILTIAMYFAYYSVEWPEKISVLIVALVVSFVIYYFKCNLKIFLWHSWVTSPDGTPAPGRRIKLYVTSDAKQLKKIKELAIYDIIPADDHQGGVIYAQCEEITDSYTTLRVIKCKGYDAPMGDDVKILVGKKQIEAKVTEETEPAKPINSTEEQPQ